MVGHPWAEHTYEVKTFLTRNHVPYRWLDVVPADIRNRGGVYGAGVPV